jgi:hypothetical protein
MLIFNKVTDNDDSGVNLQSLPFRIHHTASSRYNMHSTKTKTLSTTHQATPDPKLCKANSFQHRQHDRLFLCTSLPLPDSVSFQKGELDIVSDTGPFAHIYGVIAQYQGDNNIVVLQAGKPVWASGHMLDQGCGSPSACRMRFDEKDNLGTYFNNQLQWSSNTSGRGSSMVVLNKAPWIQIKDASDGVIWDTTKST